MAGLRSDLDVLVAAHTDSYSGSGVIAEYEYQAAPQARAGVHVITCPGGMGACPVITDYAGAWFDGSRNPDGSATVWANGPWGDRGLGYEGLYVQVWPNDASVQVDFGPDRPVDLDLAQRLATSVRLTDLDGLARERSTLTARMADWPVGCLGGPHRSGRVESARDGSANAVCVTPVGSTTTCQVRRRPTAYPVATVSFLDRGRWILAAMSAPSRTDPRHPGAMGGPTPASMSMRRSPASSEQAHRLGLLVIPPDVVFLSVAARARTAKSVPWPSSRSTVPRCEPILWLTLMSGLSRPAPSLVDAVPPHRRWRSMAIDLIELAKPRGRTVADPQVDPVTAEVVRGAMETVCFEMATYVSAHRDHADPEPVATSATPPCSTPAAGSPR